MAMQHPADTPAPAFDDARRQRAQQIQGMFGRIVPSYDRMNRIMSFGMDGGWRRMAAKTADVRGKRVLDLGTGTGDMARELVRRGAASVTGADFSAAMLAVAAGRTRGDAPCTWLAADAIRLPFADASFDQITNAFLLRNLVDLPAAFREMARVLRPGGRLVCLDMTPPKGVFTALYRLYFNRLMPPIAGFLSGDRAAYRYLPNSLTGFPDADTLSKMLMDAGFRSARYRRLGGGAVALHDAER
jgi:demethylmenaquinone methyltransferase/2-methoxy-6-polyprenyl-1,4-benzoquinol methylase